MRVIAMYERLPFTIHDHGERLLHTSNAYYHSYWVRRLCDVFYDLKLHRRFNLLLGMRVHTQLTMAAEEACQTLRRFDAGDVPEQFGIILFAVPRNS